jgi:hypothetical protein
MKSNLIVFLFLTLVSSCASRYGISNAKAYVQKAVAGTIRADDNGRPMTRGVSEHRLIFIETDTSRATPQFSAAWVKERPFSVQPVPVNRAQQSIGQTPDGKEVILSAKEGHQLWQLLLTPKDGLKADDATLQEKIRNNAVVLTGKWKNKEFTYTIPNEEQLQMIFYQ